MVEVTRAARNIQWIEQYCIVPEGKLVGQPFGLRDWQRNELIKIYDNPHITRRAIISFGRKNGKTALAAALCLLHLCGSEAVPNAQLYSAARSRDQAALLFALAAKMVRQSPDLSSVLVIRDTAKQIYCPELGSIYKAISADASTAYGFSPTFIVHDELGQVRGERSELYEALETATGAQEKPLSVIISTQAPNPTDLLSLLIDDAKSGGDPKTTLSLYEADIDLDPFSEEAIRQANPAFGDFQNADETLGMAKDAERMPSKEASYRNLILNQRVEMQAPFVSRSAWEACKSVPDSYQGAVYGGLDLSAVNDLTAKVYVHKTDKWNVLPTFWLPEYGLTEKSRSDRVPYDVWADQGYLKTTPSRTINYEFIAHDIYQDYLSFGFRKIAFDAWGFDYLKPWLLKAGFQEYQLDELFVPFRQGFKSMTPALRDLETVIINSELAHGGHPVMNMCAHNAVVTSDPAGNRKLDKSKATGRIDGMVALTMALSTALTESPEQDIASFISDPVMII